MFNNWDLVFAAYNWGEGKVQRLIDRSGKDNFWDMMDLRRNFPRETKKHVALIQASIILARNPGRYGLPADLDPPLTYDRIPVPRAVDLRSAAKLLGISLDELKGLNPALRGLSTPANYPGYELNVPAGVDSEVSEKIADLPAVKFKPPAEFASRYKVKPGDTLSSIARRYRISVAAIQTANNIASPRALKAGTWLHVPSSSGIRSSLGTARISSQRIPSKIKPAPRRKTAATAKSASKPSGS